MTPFVQDADFTDCVLWTGYIDPQGYGRVNHGKRPELAHRDAWQRANGPLAPRIELHHRCGVRACVNLAHLQPVTAQEHKTIEQAARTHCRRGHAYAEHGRWHKGTTARYCRACERENWRRRAALRR